MAHVGGHRMQTGTGKKEENTEGTSSGTSASSVYKSMWETGGLREQTSATSLAMGGSPLLQSTGLLLSRYGMRYVLCIAGRQGEPGERSDRNSLMTGNVDRDPGGTWGVHPMALTLDIVRGIWTSTDTAAVPARQQTCSVFDGTQGRSRASLCYSVRSRSAVQ